MGSYRADFGPIRVYKPPNIQRVIFFELIGARFHPRLLHMPTTLAEPLLMSGLFSNEVPSKQQRIVTYPMALAGSCFRQQVALSFQQQLMCFHCWSQCPHIVLEHMNIVTICPGLFCLHASAAIMFCSSNMFDFNISISSCLPSRKLFGLNML